MTCRCERTARVTRGRACEAARQSSRQVGLIELGAATVIHNIHTYTYTWEEQMRASVEQGWPVGGWKGGAEIVYTAVSPPLTAPSRVTCAREACFSFDYRYGMHLRSIMHPRGRGTFARSQAYPGVCSPAGPYAIFHVHTCRIARFFTPLSRASTSSVIIHRASAARLHDASAQREDA